MATFMPGFLNYDSSAAELWRTSDGTTWAQVNTDGFGDSNVLRIITLVAFDGQLYAGTDNYDIGSRLSNGAQVWRSSNGTTWEKVVDGGFGDNDNWGVGGLIVYRDQIYAITNQYNYENPKGTKGMEVWRSATGDLGSWERVGWHAFGAEHQSVYHYWHGNFVVHDDLLYIGTNANWLSGGRVWSDLPKSLYLPAIRR